MTREPLTDQERELLEMTFDKARRRPMTLGESAVLKRALHKVGGQPMPMGPAQHFMFDNERHEFVQLSGPRHHTPITQLQEPTEMASSEPGRIARLRRRLGL